MLDPNIFSRIKTKQDFDREAQEFEARKRQQDMQSQLGELQIAQAQRQINAPELDTQQILAKAIQLGGVQNLTPQEQAQLQAFDIAARTKQTVDARGNVISNRSIFDMLPTQINQMTPSQVMSAPTGAPLQIYPNDPMMANQQAAANQAASIGMPDLPNTTTPINPAYYGVTSPYGQEDVRKAQAIEAIKKQSEMGQQQLKNTRAYDQFVVGMDNLEKAMAKASTNPFIGLIPATTPEAQKAEGSVAIMAPVLKQLFREAGEGTFTDADQKILMGMLPKRTDYPSVRKAKIEAINNMVIAKLGIQTSGDERQTAPVITVEEFLSEGQ